jgi:hypothetical protein
MPSQPIEPGTEWTPEPVPCGFCGKPDEGYAKKDKDGKWKPSCWACVRPKNPPKPPELRKKPKAQVLEETHQEVVVAVEKKEDVSKVRKVCRKR